MCLRVSDRKEYEGKKYYYFASLKSLKNRVGSGSILVRGTDPGIRIRTKMSLIPNTAIMLYAHRSMKGLCFRTRKKNIPESLVPWRLSLHPDSSRMRNPRTHSL